MNKALRNYQETKDIKSTLNLLPSKEKIIPILLKNINRYKIENAEMIWKEIPISYFSLYLKSYQSVLFNKIASLRFEKFGLKVLKGDLVYEMNGGREIIKYISEEDMKSNAYSIFHILLPLPGSKTIYPDNEIKDLYEELFKEENVDPSNVYDININIFNM